MGYEEALTEARSIVATGDYDASKRAEAVLMAFAETTEDTQEQGKALRTSAVYAAKDGRVNTAIERFQDAARLLVGAFDRAVLYESMAAIVNQFGRKDLARNVHLNLTDALERCESIPNKFLPYAHIALARMLKLVGDHQTAHEHAEQAVQFAVEFESGRQEAFGVMASIKEQLGDVFGAMDLIERSIEYAFDRRCLMEAHADYSRLALMAGDTKTATHHLRTALDFPDMRDRLLLAKIQRAIAALVKVAPDQAIMLLERIAAYLETPTTTRVEVKE